MPEYNDPRHMPMIIPLVEQVERVLGNLEPQPGWFVGQEEDEHAPEPETAMGGSGASGGDDEFSSLPFDSERGPRSRGPLGGYRSFRYFDPMQPEYHPIAGTRVPLHANVWGVMLPMAVCENEARQLQFNRTGKVSATPSTDDIEEARDVLHAYYLVHFVVDRACKIIEDLLTTATGTTYSLFLSDVFVRGRTKSPESAAMLGALSQYHRYHYAESQGNAHRGRPGRMTPPPRLPYRTVGATYAQLLSNMLALAVGAAHTTTGKEIERILGLNFLVGAEIPDMSKPDLHYKFSPDGPAVRLPVHVW
jgi:hypothetical protein